RGVEKSRLGQPFLSPPVPAELDGEPVEQLRMAWQRALRAEISLALDEAASEKLRPKSIHRHACSQWVFRVHDPFAQREAIDASLRCRMKLLQRCGCDFLTGRQVVALGKDERLSLLVGREFAKNGNASRLDLR